MKKYYTIQEIAANYNITEDYLRSVIKKGAVKAIYIKGELLIPRKSFSEDYFSHNIHSPFNPRNMKRSLTDEIRAGIVNLIVIIVVPIIASLIYVKIVGSDYASTETGGLILVGVVVISAFVSYLAYQLLFEKYLDDLQDRFF